MPVSFTFSVSSGPSGTTAVAASAAADAGALAIRDKALDPLTGNLVMDGSGDQVYLRSIEAIASDLKSNWQFFKRDWYLDLNKGIDYWGVIFAKGSSLDACEDEYRREALATAGVASIDLVLTRESGRRLSVRGVVTIDEGLVFNVALGVTAP